MTKKVLIGYATKCRSTIGVAQAIAESILHSRNVVDVPQLDQVGVYPDMMA